MGKKGGVKKTEGNKRKERKNGEIKTVKRFFKQKADYPVVHFKYKTIVYSALHMPLFWKTKTEQA